MALPIQSNGIGPSPQPSDGIPGPLTSVPESTCTLQIHVAAYSTQLQGLSQSSESVLKKMERMERLLELLKDDLKEDISRDPLEKFNERITLQFQWFDEIANLRASIKGEKNIEEALIQRKDRFTCDYKTFISQIPPFRVGSEIKALLSLRTGQCDRRMGGLIANRVDFLLSSEGEIGYPGSSRLVMTRRAYKLDGVVYPCKRVEWKTRWRKLQKSLLEGYQRARPLISQDNGRQLTWVTGTSTGMLVPMVRLQIPELQGPALLPTGTLIEHGFAPLSGKLDRGIEGGGVNQSRLSGYKFPRIFDALEYADRAKTWRISKVQDELDIVNAYMENWLGKDGYKKDSFSRTQIALMRLLFARAQGMQGAKEALESVKPLIQIRINSIPTTAHQVEKFGAIIGTDVLRGGRAIDEESVAVGMIVGQRESSGRTTYGVVSRYRIFDGDLQCCVRNNESERWVREAVEMYTDEELATATEKVLAEEGGKSKTISFPFKTEKAALKDFIHSIDSEDTYPKMNEDETYLVQNPSGLLFGSWTINRKDLRKVASEVVGERAATGPQKLGKDIQVAFAEDDGVERVKKYLCQLPEHSRIHVLSIKALLYLTAAYISK